MERWLCAKAELASEAEGGASGVAGSRQTPAEAAREPELRGRGSAHGAAEDEGSPASAA